MDRITIDPAICHGNPCIAGTRIPVYIISELLGAGQNIDEIIKAYPGLTPKDIKAALSYSDEKGILPRIFKR
ncbi:MAG: DUF433 domain-containing protein [Desulfitobacteriaceae bacterium]|nr:DUF433 domain-containing protein [Desulfitobacteriaceae bacterium]